MERAGGAEGLSQEGPGRRKAIKGTFLPSWLEMLAVNVKKGDRNDGAWCLVCIEGHPLPLSGLIAVLVRSPAGTVSAYLPPWH